MVAGRRATKEYAPQVAMALKKRSLKGAIELSQQYVHSHVAKVALAGLLEYRTQQESASQNTTQAQMLGRVQRATERAADLASHDLRAHLNWLDAIGGTSPFIGALSGSIAVAGGSLLLAVASVWVCAYLKRRIAYCDAEMRNSASELVDYLDAAMTD